MTGTRGGAADGNAVLPQTATCPGRTQLMFHCWKQARMSCVLPVAAGPRPGLAVSVPPRTAASCCWAAPSTRMGAPAA